jgi:hypothetical protein
MPLLPPELHSAALLPPELHFAALFPQERHFAAILAQRFLLIADSECSGRVSRGSRRGS